MADSLDKYAISIGFLSGLGALLSVYSFQLFSALAEDDEYEPSCDISEHISCTKFLQSEYVHGTFNERTNYSNCFDAY